MTIDAKTMYILTENTRKEKKERGLKDAREELSLILDVVQKAAQSGEFHANVSMRGDLRNKWFADGIITLLVELGFEVELYLDGPKLRISWEDVQ